MSSEVKWKAGISTNVGLGMENSPYEVRP